MAAPLKYAQERSLLGRLHFALSVRLKDSSASESARQAESKR